MNWRERAACRPDPTSMDAADPEQFYATFQSKNQWSDALVFCVPCEVKAECLNFALDHETPSTVWGVWGGKTPDERKEMLQANGVGEPDGSPHVRYCPICGERFETFQANRMVCSKPCRTESVRRRSAECRRGARARKSGAA